MLDFRITADGLLADSIVASEGKLYVHGGGWNLLGSAVMPFRQPRIGVGLLLRVPYALADNMPHKFTLRLEDEDGNAVPLGDAPPGSPAEGKIKVIEGGFTVGRPPTIQPGDEQVLPIALNIDGLVFTTAGAYLFRFAVDGEEVKVLRFRVNHLMQPGIAYRA